MYHVSHVLLSEWVSEWVIVFFIAKSALLQLYQDQSNFSMRSWWGSFCTRPTRLVYLFVVLAGWNNSPRIDMSPPLGNIIQIPSQPVFALSAYCCVLSGEATNTNVIVFGCTRSGIEPTIYALKASTFTITSPILLYALLKYKLRIKRTNAYTLSKGKHFHEHFRCLNLTKLYN